MRGGIMKKVLFILLCNGNGGFRVRSIILQDAIKLQHLTSIIDDTSRQARKYYSL